MERPSSLSLGEYCCSKQIKPNGSTLSDLHPRECYSTAVSIYEMRELMAMLGDHQAADSDRLSTFRNSSQSLELAQKGCLLHLPTAAHESLRSVVGCFQHDVIHIEISCQ